MTRHRGEFAPALSIVLVRDLGFLRADKKRIEDEDENDDEDEKAPTRNPHNPGPGPRRRPRLIVRRR